MKKTAILFSGISHFIYGIFTLSLNFYKEEFVRYGFDHFRELIGGVQIVLGLCLLIGFYNYKLLLFSSLALALLMAGALGTRIYIQDGLLDSAPSFFYLVINLYIFKIAKNFLKRDI